jgi:hypothetical protein
MCTSLEKATPLAKSKVTGRAAEETSGIDVAGETT